MFLHVYSRVFVRVRTCNYVCVGTGIHPCLCVVVTYSLDCDIVVSEFELQSRYYVHF